MRVLLVNDLVSFGGTEVQHWREFDLLASRGHDVYSLTMDPAAAESLSGRRRNVPIADGPLDKALSRTLPGVHLRAIRAQVDGIAPDVVHLNNVRKAPLDVYRAVRGYPCVQTVRDYGAVCPKGTCIHGDGAQCPGYLHGDCRSCGLSAKERVKAGQIGRLNRACSEACDALVAPSEALARCCTENGLPTECLNNPFDFSKISMHSAKGYSGGTRERTYLYYGAINEDKGVGKLLEAFSSFAQGKNDVELRFVGAIAPSYASSFNEFVAANDFLTYVGTLPNEKMLDFVRKVYCVIVPSLWIENYPNTVLESMACKTLVIGSNRGGIPEMIQRSDLLFDVLDCESITKTLQRTYELGIDEYDNIVESAYSRVMENNSLETFGIRLEKVLNSAIEIFSKNGMEGR